MTRKKQNPKKKSFSASLFFINIVPMNRTAADLIAKVAITLSDSMLIIESAGVEKEITEIKFPHNFRSRNW